MRVPFSFLTEQFANPEPIFDRIREFLKRCDFTLGEDLAVFEGRYAEYCGAKHAIGVGSGTDAIFLSLKALGVLPGDEVITAPNSFIATTGAIVQAGARPVYVDVNESMDLDIEKIERAITPKTRAIVPVHWAGNPCDIEAVVQLAKKYSLFVVEDACQALGAKVNGKAVGSFGDAGAFSTHPLKPLHVWGDGGIIVTSSDALADKLRLLRNHGLSGRDTVATYGYNSRFDNLQAIVGNVVMDSLDQTIDKRIEHAGHYDKALTDRGLAACIRVPKRDSRKKHVFHLYQVYAQKRDELLKHLVGHGIEAKVHYPTPLHLQPAAQEWGYAKGTFPLTENQSDFTITLPCHQYLKSEQIDFVVEKIREFYGL